MRTSAVAVATLGLALAQAAGGCVCEQGQGVRKAVPGDDPHDPRVDPRAPPLSKESVVWDFRKRGEPPLLSLWPKDPTAPGRKKSEAKVTKQGDVLVAESEGVDSWLLWQFDAPLHFATLSAELSSPVAGTLQLYWTNVDCPMFAERCSYTQPIVAGRQFVDLVAGTARAIREIRLDLPATAGVRVEFQQLRLYGKPVLRAPASGHEPNTTIERGDDGLIVSSGSPDPWIMFSTPWLEAGGAELVEVELGGAPASQPQLFWQGGACPHFSEACSVTLAGGPNTFRGRLHGASKWSGRITALRLDPSTQPGRYVVARVSLVRSPPPK